MNTHTTLQPDSRALTQSPHSGCSPPSWPLLLWGGGWGAGTPIQALTSAERFPIARQGPSAGGSGY